MVADLGEIGLNITAVEIYLHSGNIIFYILNYISLLDLRDYQRQPRKITKMEFIRQRPRHQPSRRAAYYGKERGNSEIQRRTLYRLYLEPEGTKKLF